MRWKRRPGGRPPTLWCVLIRDAVAAVSWGVDSMTAGVERALGEEVDVAQAPRLLLEDAYELPPDHLALFLGVDHATQRFQEARAGVDVAQVEVEGAGEDVEHALGLLPPEQAVVDEDAGELIADRAVHQRRRHRRVDATA